jgi:tryptophanyl-tRNA synthetase
VLLQSLGFASPKEAGLIIGQLQQNDAQVLSALSDKLTVGEGFTEAEVSAALAALQAEIAEKTKSKA